jgi:peptidyl-prolyl cis-trans isomerase D
MISAFRRSLDTWAVRGFFILMVGSFVFWGVGDVVRNIGTGTWVAKVNGQPIEQPAFQSEFQRALAQAAQTLPPGQAPTPEMRQAVSDETLQRMTAQAAMKDELQRLHIVSPDASVRDAIMSIPGFRGPDGKFNRQTFEAVLRSNSLTEPRFVDLIRADLAQRQLLDAVASGAAVPQSETTAIFDVQFEKRSADTAEFPIAATATPPAPTEADLQRWYDNHPDSYATPEFRRIKAIELSPETLSKDIDITDADLQAAYDQRKSDYVVEGKRTAQVITASDEAKARALADTWRAGADWAAIQKDATAAGASAVELADATEVLFPDPDLGKAVFAAQADTVSAPIKGALGWFVVKVTKIVPGSTRTLDQVKDELRTRVLASKAADMMYDRANKVDELLGNGTPFDGLPGDLGLAGVAGTLDSSGETQGGTPAPIPGAPELKAAIIAAAFKARKDEPAHDLTEVQTPSTGGSAYYAVTVDDIIPPGKRPFEEVKAQVEAAWTADQQMREANASATKMLVALQGGQSFSDAATVAGVQPHLTPLVTRSEQAEGMPPELQRVLFGLKKNEPTMVETPEGFIVAAPVEIVEPDPKADAGDFDRVHQALVRSMTSDVAKVFADAITNAATISVDQNNLNAIAQP